MKKIKGFFSKVVSSVKKSARNIAMMAAMPILPITASETTAVDTSEIVDSIKGFFSDFTVSNLVTIIGAALALAVVLFIFWFAYRFIKRAVVKALTKGKI